jgi:hypothetical protein
MSYPDKRTYKERQEYKLQKEKLDTINLTDRYIIKLIKRRTNLKAKDIRTNKELIEMYRFKINLKRIIQNDRKT